MVQNRKFPLSSKPEDMVKLLCIIAGKLGEVLIWRFGKFSMVTKFNACTFMILNIQIAKF